MTNTQNNQISNGVSVEGNTTLSNETGNSSGSADNTTENVATKDPEKNKKLVEIKMSEQLRETYSLKITIPKIIKGLHTNSFLFMDVVDDFYEKNYPELVSVIADKKFARYAGFKKGRFFIDNVEEFGGVDGWGMEIDLNPLAPSLGSYNQMQQEAEKALIQAIKSENQGSGNNTGTSSGSAGLTTMSGDDCSDTFGISTRSFDINQTANHQIGNSSANYATDTSGMDAKTAVMDVYNRFKYLGYSNNRTCPQKMWNKSGTIRGNCADIARLVMCMAQVHGLRAGIHHTTNHYYNLIEVNGQTYRFDCCFKGGRCSAQYGGDICNTLSMRGGPWQ